MSQIYFQNRLNIAFLVMILIILNLSKPKINNRNLKFYKNNHEIFMLSKTRILINRIAYSRITI